QVLLQTQDDITGHHHCRIAEQQYHAIALPGHRFGRIDAEQAIGTTLQNVVGRALEEVGHPFAQDHNQGGHDREDDYELIDVVKHKSVLQILSRATMNPAVSTKKTSVTITKTKSPICVTRK